jgi:hypothetical protein
MQKQLYPVICEINLLIYDEASYLSIACFINEKQRSLKDDGVTGVFCSKAFDYMV